MEDYEQEIDGQWYSDTERVLHLKAWEMSSIEVLLKSWAEKAGGLRWMHIKSSDIWRKLDTKLNYCGIILSSIVSATSMLGAMENIVPKETMMIFVSLIGILNIISQSFIKFYNSSEKAALHDTAARQFGNFNRYIATKLSMSRMDRGPPNEILNYALKEYERVYNENPDPHPQSIELFKIFIKNQEVYTSNVSFAVPDLINSSFYVNIHDKNPLFNDIEKNQLEQMKNTPELYHQVRNVKQFKNYHKQDSFDLMKKIYSNTPITPSVAKKSLDETVVVDDDSVV
jgi:hypothetical protein